MTSKSNPGKAKDPVQIALDEYRDSWMEGNHLDPDIFCRSYPEFGEVLREKIQDFLFVMERVPHAEALDEEEESGSTEENEVDSSRKLGDFRIIREIGRGGMGTVYEAEQISLRRKVALKVLPTHMRFSRQAVLKFRREAEAAGRQRHPGIVAVHAVGEHRGVHYIAQELLEDGRTLSDWLEEIQKLDQPKGYFRDMARLISEVADALQHAHDSGVIHRDVKPTNILLTPEGSPKVTDFGLAKVENAMALSRSGDFSGTPYYMSPEQVSLRHLNIDHRTDIFSLGVTLYEALTFVKPFEGENSHEVLKKILIHEPRDPRKVNPRIPHDLAVICLKAMEKDTDRRYKSMAGFAADLRRFISGEVIEATPTGPGARACKWVKRHPVVSLPVGVMLLATVAFIGYVLFWSYPRIKEEKEIAVGALVTAEEQRKLAESEKEKTKKERERANAEAEKANAEATTAKTVLDFLVGLFRSPDPKEARGAEITAKEILDKGVERIKEDFEAQPGIKARLLSTMGSVYESLGQFSDAEPLLEQALELHRNLPDVNQKDVLSSMEALASLYWQQGRYEESEPLFLEVLEQRRHILGDDHLGTISTMVNLANLYRERGNYEEAERLYLVGLEVLRRVRGSNHHDTLVVMMNLAELYNQVGKYDKSEPLSHEALKGLSSLSGDDHPATLNARNALSFSYLEQGKFKEANVFLLDSLKYFRRVLGDDHPETLTTISNLANSYMELGLYKEAEPLLLEAIEGLRRVLGDENPKTLSAIQNLGALYFLTGRFKEAEPLYIEALEGLRRTLGDDHPQTTSALNTLALLYKEQGRYEEAEPLYLEHLEIVRRTLGNEHQNTYTGMINLACLYMGLGRSKEAESLLLEALEGTRRILGDDHVRTFSAMHNLAYVYAGQGRFKKAEVLYLEALESKRRVLGPDHPNTLSTLDSLASMYLYQKRNEEAEPLYLEAVNGRRRTLGDQHPKTLTSVANLGNFYLAQNKLKKAEPLCLEAYEGVRHSLGMDHPETLLALYNLIIVYGKSGRDEEAESLAGELVKHTPKDSKDYKIHKDLLEQIRRKLGRDESGS